jgi:hypothetical protein
MRARDVVELVVEKAADATAATVAAGDDDTGSDDAT